MRTRISKLAELVRAPVNDIESRIQKMQESLKLNDKKKASLGAGNVDKMISSAQHLNGINLIIQNFEATAVDDLRLIADALRNQSENSIYLLTATDGEKLQVIFGTSLKMDSKKDVRPIFKTIQPILDVRGGGRADCIQAGGVTPTNLNEKLEQAQQILVEQLLQKVS